MYEWLVEEMARVRTRKFFVVDGPASNELRKAIDDSGVPVPPSYRVFVLEFGNANLYRKLDYYLVRVYAAPRDVQAEGSERLLHFGRADDSFAYFKESLLIPDEESPVFEWQHGQELRESADSFEEWLRKKGKAARKRYTKKEWREIEKGPPPFTDQENRIVEARHKFRWRVVGVADNGDLQFEVYNGSKVVLPYLSVGICHKGGEPFGGVKLPVFDIQPGETKVIEIDCYKESHDPRKVEAFEKPEPGPEDRDRYWEFRALPRNSET